MTPAPLQLGQAPSELALNSDGFTPLAFANALRIGSSSPVYVAGLLRREPRMGAWSIDTTPARAGIDPCTSELLPEPATPVTTTSTPSGMSTSTSRRLCAVAPRISSVPVGFRTVSLRAARSPRWRPMRVPLASSPSTVPSKQTVPPAVSAPGPRSTTWSASRSSPARARRRAACCPCPAAEAAGRSSVGCHRVHARGGLIEDVSDVGERGAEVANHLGALCLPTRQCARRPVERDVAQPDLHERVEGLQQGGEQRRDRRLVEATDPVGEVADLHRAGVGDVDPANPRGAGGLTEQGAAAVGTGGEGDRPVDERPDVRLQRVGVLGEHRLLHLGNQPLVSEIDAVDLHLDRLLVEEVVELLLGVLADRLVRAAWWDVETVKPGSGGSGEDRRRRCKSR